MNQGCWPLQGSIVCLRMHCLIFLFCFFFLVAFEVLNM